MNLVNRFRNWFKNWLIGYEVSGLTVEVTLVGYDTLVKQLDELDRRFEHVGNQMDRASVKAERLIALTGKLKLK